MFCKVQKITKKLFTDEDVNIEDCRKELTTAQNLVMPLIKKLSENHQGVKLVLSKHFETIKSSIKQTLEDLQE